MVSGRFAMARTDRTLANSLQSWVLGSRADANVPAILWIIYRGRDPKGKLIFYGLKSGVIYEKQPIISQNTHTPARYRL
jgi:hypothetical protein